MMVMDHEEPLVRIIKNKQQNLLTVSPQVNTKDYHDAFGEIPIPKPIAEAAYKQAGRILQRANGSNNEYLVAINARTGKLVTDNLSIDPAVENKTGFTFKQKELIESVQDGVILLHNHPASTRPSLRDVITAAEEQSIQGSIVLAHDSDIWFISINDPAIASVADSLYNRATLRYAKRARTIALSELLDLNEKHNWFIWKKVR